MAQGNVLVHERRRGARERVGSCERCRPRLARDRCAHLAASAENIHGCGERDGPRDAASVAASSCCDDHGRRSDATAGGDGARKKRLPDVRHAAGCARRAGARRRVCAAARGLHGRADRMGCRLYGAGCEVSSLSVVRLRAGRVHGGADWHTGRERSERLAARLIESRSRSHARHTLFGHDQRAHHACAREHRIRSGFASPRHGF